MNAVDSALILTSVSGCIVPLALTFWMTVRNETSSVSTFRALTSSRNTLAKTKTLKNATMPPMINIFFLLFDFFATMTPNFLHFHYLEYPKGLLKLFAE